ncbi:hypothetical protein, partial [Okeania sp. SIO3I5]|uniref:hypothetical protein n=1 Tax=Okeania sp. SIO3I5 TaxID=2607805 RepID=UPI0025D1D76B
TKFKKGCYIATCDLFLHFNNLWLVFIVKINFFSSIFCRFIFPGSGVSYLFSPALSRSAIFYENGINMAALPKS